MSKLTEQKIIRAPKGLDLKTTPHDIVLEGDIMAMDDSGNVTKQKLYKVVPKMPKTVYHLQRCLSNKIEI